MDYRLDNLLFTSNDAGIDVAAGRLAEHYLGSPLSDVAYFIGAGLTSADRAPVEEQLVRGYFDALCASGVTIFSGPNVGKPTAMVLFLDSR